MSDETSRRQREGYQKLLDRLGEHVSKSGKIEAEKLLEVVEDGKSLMHAAGEMSKDEAELVATYFKRDLHAFLSSLRSEKKAVRDWFSYSQLEKGFWHMVTELSDRTQLEWHELAEDFRHHGVYYTGEVVGHGNFSCNQCGRTVEVTHPTSLVPCRHCGGREFSRRGFKP